MEGDAGTRLALTRGLLSQGCSRNPWAGAMADLQQAASATSKPAKMASGCPVVSPPAAGSQGRVMSWHPGTFSCHIPCLFWELAPAASFTYCLALSAAVSSGQTFTPQFVKASHEAETAMRRAQVCRLASPGSAHTGPAFPLSHGASLLGRS